MKLKKGKLVVKKGSFHEPCGKKFCLGCGNGVCLYCGKREHKKPCGGMLFPNGKCENCGAALKSSLEDTDADGNRGRIVTYCSKCDD